MDCSGVPVRAWIWWVKERVDHRPVIETECLVLRVVSSDSDQIVRLERNC